MLLGPRRRPRYAARTVRVNPWLRRTILSTVEPVVQRTLRRLRGEQDVKSLVAQGLELGPNVYIGQRVFLDAGNPWLITIGEGSVLTSGTVVLAHDGSTRLHTGCTRIARTVIGKRVFVGAGAVILAGSAVGDECIIGPLTVVRGEIPPRSIVVGNPGCVVADVDSFASRHAEAVERAPVWPHDGSMAGRGITEARKHEQVEALVHARSGYLRASPQTRSGVELA
jgi:maltose O-acetyltransferase